MAFVSVTRLRPRGIRFLPMLVQHSWRSAGQVRQADGFLGGYLASGPKFALWTVTVWRDEAPMRSFRNAAFHLAAMPKLIGSCDEASVAHWRTDDAALPAPAEVAAAMGRSGRTSKLRHPSVAHAAGNAWPDAIVPRRGPGLSPRG